MIRSLFVYGTLRKDARHAMHGLLARSSTFVGTGWVSGRLYDLGRYPGAVPAGPYARVRGEVYDLDEPDASLPLLDEYEGCAPGDPAPHAFRRETTYASLDDATRLRVWIYWYDGPLGRAQEIPSGDYLRPE